MEPLFRRTVVLLVDAFFPRGQGQYLGIAVPTEDSAFEGIKVAIAWGGAVHRPILRRGPAEVAKVGTVVKIKTRHLVEANDRVEFFGREGFLQTTEKPPVADVVSPKTA